MASVCLAASNVTLQWDPLATGSDATGVRVYQSATPGSYNRTTGKVCDVARAATQCTVPNLADGTYYWVATAYDAAGNESGYSNEVRSVLDSSSPPAPSNLRAISVTVTVVVP